jgi:DNA-binding CsgD family transcriptional regulator
MKPTEFFTTPEGDITIKTEGEPERNLSEHDMEFNDNFINELAEFYPEALNALREIYSKSQMNRSYYNYLQVRRFCKCNFGIYDNRLDIDRNNAFKFEFVSCPLRGECKYDHIICQPKFNTALSDRQLEVMHLFFDGLDELQIADRLFLSVQTIRNHRKNSLRKLGLHSMADFLIYARSKNMF